MQVYILHEFVSTPSRVSYIGYLPNSVAKELSEK